MRHIKYIIMTVLLAIAGNTMAEGLFIDNFLIMPNEEKTVSINLETGNVQYMAFEFRLKLPTGFTIAKDNNGALKASLNASRSYNHSLEVEAEEDNIYHFLCYSSKNNALRGDKGEIISLAIKAETNNVSTYSANIFDVMLMTTDKEKHTVSSTFNITIPQLAESLRLDSHGMSVAVGESVELKAYISPDNTYDKTVKWSSRNEEIAEVNTSGKVTAKKAGKVYVVATAVSNPEAKDSCEVTVLQPTTGITISDSEITLDGIGKTKKLTVKVLPEDASLKTVEWKSYDESVCAVTSDGLVIALGYGDATVTATTVNGGYVATCICHVVENKPEVLKGDIDGNGEVNTTDVTALYNVIFGTDTTTDRSICDLDGNGEVNTTDVTALYNIIFGTAQ